MNDFYTEHEAALEYTGEHLLRDLQTLNETAPELAKRLRLWGDHRSVKTIVRAVQRMLSGDTAVSGEMRVIISMLLYRQRQREQLYKDLRWNEQDDGSVSTTVGDYKIALYPQTKRRWLVLITNKQGRNHPWPDWQYDLDDAKQMALKVLDDAVRWDFEESLGLTYA